MIQNILVSFSSANAIPSVVSTALYLGTASPVKRKNSSRMAAAGGKESVLYKDPEVNICANSKTVEPNKHS